MVTTATSWPIHSGNFNLAFHAWYEPMERVCKAAQQQDLEPQYRLLGELTAIILLPKSLLVRSFHQVLRKQFDCMPSHPQED